MNTTELQLTARLHAMLDRDTAELSRIADVCRRRGLTDLAEKIHGVLSGMLDSSRSNKDEDVPPLEVG